MSYDQAVTDLRTHFVNNWTQTPISRPNHEYDPQDNTDANGVPKDFVKFNTQHGEATKLEVGDSGITRYPGVLFLGINIRTGKGKGAIYGYMDDLSSMFEDTRIGVVNVHKPNPAGAEKSDDGNWLQQNLNFGFDWESTT